MTTKPRKTRKLPPRVTKRPPAIFQYDGSLLGEYSLSLKELFNPDEKKPTKAESGMTWD